MKLEREVAAGIHRIEDAYTNWYLVEGGNGELTIVDAGVRTSWHSCRAALDELGFSADDVRALVLTHAHFDHIGFAERARQEFGVPVFVHTDDVVLTKHPLQYSHARSRIPYLANPKAMPIMASLVRSGAFWPTPIAEVRRFNGSSSLDVPGSPSVVRTPGHTLGHCALHFPDRDAVIAGDAIVMLDPYTAAEGPRLVAGAATADPERAMDSLGALEATGAKVVLTGHGPAFREGVAQAAATARSAGLS